MSQHRDKKVIWLFCLTNWGVWGRW